VGGLLGTIFSVLRTSQVNEETAIAYQAVHGMLEELQSQPFEQIYAAYNADPEDDPDPEADPLALLEVPGLMPCEGDPGNTTAVIEFPTVSGDGGIELREDADNPLLGMPRDLNGDNELDSLDHSGDYTMLPLAVRLQWEGASGQREITVPTMLRRNSDG
jgi:hypothetical protein